MVNIGNINKIIDVFFFYLSVPDGPIRGDIPWALLYYNDGHEKKWTKGDYSENGRLLSAGCYNAIFHFDIDMISLYIRFNLV